MASEGMSNLLQSKFIRTIKEKVVTEEELEWGKLKKVTLEGKELSEEEQEIQLKKISLESAKSLELEERKKYEAVSEVILKDIFLVVF